MYRPGGSGFQLKPVPCLTGYHAGEVVQGCTVYGTRGCNDESRMIGETKETVKEFVGRMKMVKTLKNFC